MAGLPNDGSFFELFQKEAAEKEAETVNDETVKDDDEPKPPLSIEPSPNLEPATASSSNSDSLFLPSASFTGPKAGFIFKLGEAGLGR